MVWLLKSAQSIQLLPLSKNSPKYLRWYKILFLSCEHCLNNNLLSDTLFCDLHSSLFKRQNSNKADEKLIDVKKIRNFSIVAHVDHGKSTLADRLLELTGAIKPGAERAQVLDQLQVRLKKDGVTI